MQGVTSEIVNPDPRQFALMRQLLNPKQLKQGIYQAVRRTTTAAKKIFVEIIQERTTLDDKYAKRVISSRVQSGDIPVGTVTISRQSVPVVAYDVVNIVGAGAAVMPTKDMAPILLRHAFIARLRTATQTARGFKGHTGIAFRGRGRPGAVTPRGVAWRLPVEEAKGPSVVSIIDRDAVTKEAMEKLGNRFDKELGGQVERFLNAKPPDTSEAA